MLSSPLKAEEPQPDGEDGNAIETPAVDRSVEPPEKDEEKPTPEAESAPVAEGGDAQGEPPNTEKVDRSLDIPANDDVGSAIDAENPTPEAGSPLTVDGDEAPDELQGAIEATVLDCCAGVQTDPVRFEMLSSPLKAEEPLPDAEDGDEIETPAVDRSVDLSEKDEVGSAVDEEKAEAEADSPLTVDGGDAPEELQGAVDADEIETPAVDRSVEVPENHEAVSARNFANVELELEDDEPELLPDSQLELLPDSQLEPEDAELELPDADQGEEPDPEVPADDVNESPAVPEIETPEAPPPPENRRQAEIDAEAYRAMVALHAPGEIDSDAFRAMVTPHAPRTEPGEPHRKLVRARLRRRKQRAPVEPQTHKPTVASASSADTAEEEQNE
jgi:hypothetical protein